MSANFSTTKPAELVASQIAHMDMLQDVFNYGITTDCGFPQISLEGTQEDWQLLRMKAEKLISEKCLSLFSGKWLPSLLPVLDRFSEQHKKPGSVDVHFWESMAKTNWQSFGSSNERFINGWINVFFPIYDGNELNPFCVPYSKDVDYAKNGVLEIYIPEGWSVAPAIWKYYDEKIGVEFRAGFVGVAQDEDGTI